MSKVLEINDITFQGDVLHVEAVVDDMVIVRPQTTLDPAEWGPALCRGSMMLTDETTIPATEAGMRKMLGESISDWAPVDQSDLYDDY
jgi:hypothetical protein